MKSWIIALLTLLPATLVAQRFTAGEIKTKADEALKQYVNADIFKSCAYSDTNTYYSYREGDDIAWAVMGHEITTKDNVVKVFVKYTLSYAYAKCPMLDTINGTMLMRFDNRLQTLSGPDVSFIPELMRNGGQCKFISKADAQTFARSYNFEPASYNDGSLVYDMDRQMYVWIFRASKPGTMAFKNSEGAITHMEGYVKELLDIDAATGALIKHTFFPTDDNPMDLRKDNTVRIEIK